MKRLSFLVLAVVGLSLAACGGGGGGGDEEAFCDALDALSEQVEAGDLADDGGLDDVTDTVNELIEAAEDGEQLDAVNAVGEEVQGADPDDADDTAETIQDELGDFAEDCEIDEDEFAIPPATTGTTATTDTTETTAATSDTTGTTDGGDAIIVSARQPVPGDIAPEFAGLAQACFEGDMESCDQLFFDTPPDSPDEAYGDTCAGRIPEGTGVECTTVFPGPQPVPGDVVDQATAGTCFDGDMGACDALLQSDNEADQRYGFFCGGRIDDTVADTDVLCVGIFGDQAFN